MITKCLLRNNSLNNHNSSSKINQYNSKLIRLSPNLFLKRKHKRKEEGVNKKH